jgi:hypothetical protein
MSREQASEDRVEVAVEVAAAGNLGGEVLVKGGRFLGEVLEQEVVGGGLAADVMGEEAHG